MEIVRRSAAPARSYDHEEIAAFKKMWPDEFFSRAYLKDRAKFPWSPRHSMTIGTIAIALKQAGIETIGELCKLKKSDALRLVSGGATQKLLIQSIDFHGLTFADE
jgi:hypothetical protein